MGHSQVEASQLFDFTGRRKYLCDTEGQRFLGALVTEPVLTQAFCRLLAVTGCRLSEALAVTAASLDVEAGHVIFRTLKRRKACFRAVPIPEGFMDTLVSLAEGQDRLFPWCRQTAWRRVKRVMAAAGITGPQAAPKGLRHRFGIRAAASNVPTALTQRWMGHARAETTAIYQQVVGVEERRFAARMWDAE